MKQKQTKQDDIKLHDYLLMETIVMLSADLFQEVYDVCESWTDTCEEIIDLAIKFEKELKWDANGNEERDYIEELEKFEQKVRSELNH